jgi:hypothetical protein
MMFVDFQQVGRPVVRCLFGAGPVTEACSSFFGEIDPRPVGRLAAWWGAEVGKKEGVHNVHTLGLGSGRTGAGPGRIAEVFGGVADIQGLEPGSSPTSGTHDPSSEGFCVDVCT